MTTGIKQGVFYRISDYAGIGRRLFIIVVDSMIVFGLLFLLSFVAEFSESVAGAFVLGCFLICYTYLAVLKATPLGTIGYMLAGVRLSDLRGRRAPLWRSTFRFGFLVLGPFNMLFDILWLGGDPNRQSLRDKFAGTYVVREKATPAGHGPIDYKIYLMFGYSFIFAEVVRTATDPENERLSSKAPEVDEVSS